MVGRPIATIALATHLMPAPSPGAELGPVIGFPLALECTLLAMQHAKGVADGATTPDDPSNSNRCIQAVQAYARTNCPKSVKTIWAQIEAVADTGISDDEIALRAACR